MAADGILGDLAAKVMSYRGEYTEAIVVSGDGESAHIYHVDRDSLATCRDDVGFVAIGAGEPHAKSQLMSTQYNNGMNFPTALGLLYAAKKRAEMAPGVGKETDLFVVYRTGHEEIWPEIKAEMERLYNEFESERLSLADEKLRELAESLAVIGKNRQAAASAASPSSSDPAPEDGKNHSSASEERTAEKRARNRSPRRRPQSQGPSQ